MASDLPITQLISAAHAGDRDAADRLYQVVYDELRRLAHGVHHGDAGHTLVTTELVHEAWLKLALAPASDVESRVHFRHIAARAMRQVLVDQARIRNAAKRGAGAVPVTLQEGLVSGQGTIDALRLLELEAALADLEEVDPRAAQVVECRFFGGLDVEETAQALGISTATVKRDWRIARARLAKVLG